MKTILLVAAAAVVAPVSAGGATAGEWRDTFPLDTLTLSASGDNRYWSLVPGNFVVLGSLEGEGSEFVVISVLDETELVDGVETRVIEEREYRDGQLAEVSRNFFAGATETGDVYYFGEDVDYYKDGQIIGHAGEWRAGAGDARPGLYMPQQPVAGMRYYMEVAPGAAMDRAEIFETGATIETRVGRFDDCLVVTESSPLEPDDESYKRYAPGVGMIFDDGLELMKHGVRRPSERWLIEFRIGENQLPAIPARTLHELHPTGMIHEVKVEIRRSHARYAIETFVDGKQWDVEVNDDGKVNRNERD